MKGVPEVKAVPGVHLGKSHGSGENTEVLEPRPSAAGCSVQGFRV